MPRNAVIALLALLAIVLLVPVVISVSAGLARAPRSGAESASDPADAGGAPAPGAALRPADVGWVYVPPTLDGPRLAYTMQAGTLADQAPAIDVDVPWAADTLRHIGREPAVGPNIDGTVVFAADDGTGSAIRRVGVGPERVDERLARLTEIVWSMAVAPDGAHAYLALVDRNDDEKDLGVVRLALDGSGQIDQVMPPTRAVSNLPSIRTVDFVRFDVDLEISADGRHLVRGACLGFDGCQVDVLDLDTAAITVLALEGGNITGVTGGILLAQHCGDGDCWPEAIELATGEVGEFRMAGSQYVITLLDDRATIVFVDDATGDLRALDPRDGRVTDLLHPPDGWHLWRGAHTVDGQLRISTPAGYVFLVRPDRQYLAVPLDGGEPVELPDAPIGPPQRGG